MEEAIRKLKKEKGLTAVAAHDAQLNYIQIENSQLLDMKCRDETMKRKVDVTEVTLLMGKFWLGKMDTSLGHKYSISLINKIGEVEYVTTIHFR